MKFIYLLMAALVVLINHSAYSQQTLDRIIAVVNDEPIFESEVNEAFRRMFNEEQAASMDQTEYMRAQSNIIRILVNDKLIMQYVQDNMSSDQRESIRKYISEQVQAQLKEMQSEFNTPEELLRQEQYHGMSWDELRANLEKVFYKEHISRYIIPQMSRERIGEISDADIRKYKDENPNVADTTGKLQIAHILLRLPGDATIKEEQDKMALANEIAEQARSGINFAELVQKYSEHEETVKLGGQLPAFEKGDYFEEFDALFGMNPGEVPDPIRTPAGIHIVKITENSSIKDRIFQERWKTATEDWLKELRDKAVIKMRQGDELVKIKSGF